VDVRSEPYSRHAPEFQKTELDAIAAEAGYGYRWLGRGLGGRPDDPSLQRPDGSPDYGAIAASPGFTGAMDELEGLARRGHVVLLCAETTPDHCHRARLLAPALEGRGHHVVHILGDGTLRPHQPDLGI
jgi:uncharacterized protein (DUF488 family)